MVVGELSRNFKGDYCINPPSAPLLATLSGTCVNDFSDLKLFGAFQSQVLTPAPDILSPDRKYSRNIGNPHFIRAFCLSHAPLPLLVQLWGGFGRTVAFSRTFFKSCRIWTQGATMAAMSWILRWTSQ
jgi:hypothetical protein